MRRVAIPDTRLDLFIRFCLQGQGHLSRNRRGQFSELTDEECARLKQIVGEAMAQAKPPQEE